MTDTFAQASHARERGTAQPEDPEEKRRRLHREAAEDVKHHAAALRDAKARYREYDRVMSNPTETVYEPQEAKEPSGAISGPKD